ncbi:hypothetical protein MKX01_011961 [Papaver californicum]|nr:hypothetical protein MKX01_011961 [Papaver californicum]
MTRTSLVNFKRLNKFSYPCDQHQYFPEGYRFCGGCNREIVSSNYLGCMRAFWQQKYCPSHEYDCTARCCSCERLEETAISVFYPKEDMNDQGYTTFGYMQMQMVVAHGVRCAERLVLAMT